MELYPLLVDVLHVLMYAPALGDKGHDVADVIGRRDDGRGHEGLFDTLYEARVGHLDGVVNCCHGTIDQVNLVLDTWRCGDQGKVEFPLQPLLHDLHVKQAQISAPEPESEGE